jgi:hypothetical protein
MEAIEDDFRGWLVDLDIGQGADDGQVVIGDLLIENGL